MKERTVDWSSRAESLMRAVSDLRLDTSTRPTRYDFDNTRHTALFEQYVGELRHAKAWADSWWTSLIKMEVQRTDNPTIAKQLVKIRNPVGPVAHGSVIAVVRKYWLECVAMNAEQPAAEQVPPEQFLLGSLLCPAHEELARFLSSLPYWPIGMDADGRWV